MAIDRFRLVNLQRAVEDLTGKPVGRPTYTRQDVIKRRPELLQLFRENPDASIQDIIAVLDPEARKETARTRAFHETRLSLEQKAVLASDARTIPGTSVQRTRPNRGDLTPPDPTKKPGESDEDAYARLKRQTLDLGVPANRATSSTMAKPIDTATDTETFGEVGGATYQRRKAKELADEEAKARYLMSAAESRQKTAPTDYQPRFKAAEALMRARGESTDPKSPGYSQRLRRATWDVTR